MIYEIIVAKIYFRVCDVGEKFVPFTEGRLCPIFELSDK